MTADNSSRKDLTKDARSAGQDAPKVDAETVLALRVFSFKQVEKRLLREETFGLGVINAVAVRLVLLTGDMLDTSIIVRKQPPRNQYIAVLLSPAINPECHAHLDNRGR